MKAHLQYLSYVIRHKWFVFRAGWALDVGLWQLIIHDWTKFLPVEWFPYVDRFYGQYAGLPEPDSKGYFHEPGDSAAYDMAWEHHWQNNPHHWQYWTTQSPIVASLLSISNEPLADCVPMPKMYAREMVADWIGAGRAQGTPDTEAWYDHNADRIILHPETRAMVERVIGEAKLLHLIK